MTIQSLITVCVLLFLGVHLQEGVCSDPGAPPLHPGRFLEDGVGAEHPEHRHVDPVHRERQGKEESPSTNGDNSPPLLVIKGH